MIQTITALIIIFILGAVFGSFACCQAWRLRLRSKGEKKLGGRSVCLHCHKQLAWYDNIPIISWLALRGKCRHCKKPIGASEIIAEVGLGVAFVAVSWQYFAGLFGVLSSRNCVAPFCAVPSSGTQFILTTILMIVLGIMLVFLGILAVYDGKWGELPNSILIASIICGAVVGALSAWIKISIGGDPLRVIGGLLVGVLLLSGIYFLFYKISHERWMGGGDWLLALGIAFAICDWWLALWILFLSNLIACLVMLPVVKKDRKRRIHFGPFMILAFVFVIALAKFISGMMIIV